MTMTRNPHQRETSPRDMLGIREAARLMGVHENTMRNWIDDKVIYSVKLPRSGYRRIPRYEVVRLLREQVEQARQERKQR